MSIPQTHLKTNPLSRNQTKPIRGEPQVVYRDVPAAHVPDPVYIFRSKASNAPAIVERPEGCRGKALLCFSTEEIAQRYTLSVADSFNSTWTLAPQALTGIYAQLDFFFLDGRLVRREKQEKVL